jgi:hypothetical protein
MDGRECVVSEVLSRFDSPSIMPEVPSWKQTSGVASAQASRFKALPACPDATIGLPLRCLDSIPARYR